MYSMIYTYALGKTAILQTATRLSSSRHAGTLVRLHGHALLCLYTLLRLHSLAFLYLLDECLIRQWWQ